MVGFRVAQARKVALLDRPTYVIRDSAHSLSKTPDTLPDAVAFLRYLLRQPISPAAARTLRGRLGRLWHMQAELALAAGQLGSAWRHHLRSLSAPAGLRYLSFTRKLL
ncbi:MAG: hypothetical protein FJX68_07460 [Alphaproteobacteria bacterium]|nr:hypothetical protein [Alphaproteobacteria bacterium]